jgi:hypothetical protein
VGGIVEEALLPLEERSAHLGEDLHLGERDLSAAAVPDEPEEDRQHEWNHERRRIDPGDYGRDRTRREHGARDLGPVTP